MRAHIKLHEERDVEMEIGDADSGNETDRPPKKKRRGGEQGRDWKCEFVGCDKDFKSVSLFLLQLIAHAKHEYVPEKRPEQPYKRHSPW